MISCDVFEVEIDQKPSFKALSYTWDLDPQWDTFKFEFTEDEKKEERPVLCNGKTHHVTMNLYHALTEFRRQKSHDPIWADQICINQDDRDEKAAQLSIMVDIYTSAKCVIIWLGKMTMVRNNALDFMENLPDEDLRSVQTPPASESKMNMNKISRSLDTISSISNSIGEHYHWMGAMLVIGRRWFARAWTLQEFLLATHFKILMGNREIKPESIVRTASRIIDFFATDPLSTEFGLNVTFLTLRRYLEGRATLFEEREKFKDGKRYSAEEYLGIIRVRRATEMKDKVVAGAALLKQDKPSSVDYRSTTLEIYIAYASELLWPEVGVFSLSLVGGTLPATEGLPSWVPDLNTPLRPEPLRYCGCPTFKAPLPSQGSDFHIEGRILQVRAARWDVIKEVGESIWSWTRYDDDPYNQDKRLKMRTSGTALHERFGLMFAMLNNLGATYAPTQEPTIDVFWQTLIGGINLKSDDDISIWRDRFRQWFAFTVVNIRYNLHSAKSESTKTKFVSTSSPKKWMVPLIADWDRLEQRVSSFLDLHDQHISTSASPQSTLRDTISAIAKRLWGTEKLENSGFWKESLAEALSTMRREQVFEPISVFGQHFETIYDGRRIFTSEKGYLGTGPEDVRTGDLVVLVEGAFVPYVLRPVVNKESTFSLVGEAYVHGVMDGGEKLTEGLDWSKFNII